MQLVRRFRPSPAMVVACFALVAALAGTSVAAVNALVPRNSVGSAQVIDNSLQKQDFKAGQFPAGARGATGATGPAGPPGPSVAYTERSGSPLTLFAQQSLVGFIRVDPGSYVFWAKGYVVGNNAVATCRLTAENDVDESKVSSAANYPGSISNGLTHTFTSTGAVSYTCGLESGTGTLMSMQIVAIRVGTLSNP